MKLRLFFSFLALSSCVSYPNKAVVLNAQNTVYEGTLRYDGPYSGLLTVPSGPKSESFSGRFIVVDKTSTKVSSGNIVVPNNGIVPAVGTTNTTESGEVNAEGYWLGKGNKGSTINCTLSVGRGGHGSGKCKTSDSEELSIIL